MNDNVPYFKDRIYTARVPENTDAGTVVITVTAEDKDEGNTVIIIMVLFVLQHDCWITQYLPCRTVHIIEHKSSYEHNITYAV